MSKLIEIDKLIRNLKKWSDISPGIQRRNEDFIKILENEDAVKAIPIPDGATNGDMQKAMHPNAIIQINELGDMVHVKYNNHTCWVNYELDWWNTPYKSGIEPQESDMEKRKEWSHKPCVNCEDGCEEWAGCPCMYYKGKSEG